MSVCNIGLKYGLVGWFMMYLIREKSAGLVSLLILEISISNEKLSSFEML